MPEFDSTFYLYRVYSNAVFFISESVEEYFKLQFLNLKLNYFAETYLSARNFTVTLKYGIIPEQKST